MALLGLASMGAWRSSVSGAVHWVCTEKCVEEQPGLQVRADRGWSWCLSRGFQTQTCFLATGVCTRIAPAPGCLSQLSAAPACSMPWASQERCVTWVLLAGGGTVHVVTDLLFFPLKWRFLQPPGVLWFRTEGKTSLITWGCLFNSPYYIMLH